MKTRLDQLKAKLAARTAPDGRPLLGFKKNVAAIRLEIARREADPAAQTAGA